MAGIFCQYVTDSRNPTTADSRCQINSLEFVIKFEWSSFLRLHYEMIVHSCSCIFRPVF